MSAPRLASLPSARAPRRVPASPAPRSPARPTDPARARAAAKGQLPSARACPCAGDCPRCAGRPLPAALAAPLSRHFGADLSAVRLHTGEASAVAAAGARRAFAQGEHIVLAAPHVGTQDAALLAHEVAHVVQQRGGGARARATTASLEAEAHRSAAAFASGRPATPVQGGRAAAGVPQFDEPAGGTPGTSTVTATDDSGRLRAQAWFAQWMAQQPMGPGISAPGNGVPLRWLEPPSLLGAETLDVGSLYTPYHQRNLFPGGGLALRDTPVIDSLFNDRLHFVSLLPEVRDIVPSFARSWIPSNWRVGLAATLTSTTVDWALSHDQPNFFELSNQSFERFTGATTYSTPMLTVPVLNGLWNRFTGGGR